MKFFAAILAVLFMTAQFDVPLAASKASARCCCGSTVCRCAPGEGKLCPLKRSRAAEPHQGTAASGRSCHFSKMAQKPEPSRSAFSAQTVPAKVVFRAARCGTNGEKASLPTHAKDFFWLDFSEFLNAAVYTPGPGQVPSQVSAVWRAPIDHPPRAF